MFYSPYTPTSFLRKGQPGDWKEKFTREAGVIFDKCAGKELILLGYEKDNSWIETLSENYSIMKILLNGTTLVKGGALQACLSFISEAVKDNDIDWRFVIFREIANQLEVAGFDISKDKSFHVVDDSPSQNFKARKKLFAIEKQLSPDAIFTFFGSAYVKFSAKHFMGFADPWVARPNKFALDSRPTLNKKLKNSLVVWYKKPG